VHPLLARGPDRPAPHAAPDTAAAAGRWRPRGGAGDFTAGTWWSLEHSLHTQYENGPSQFVLVFGAFGTTFVTVLYVPARSSLQGRGQQLCDSLFPLRGLDYESVILSQASDRQTLGQVLGLDRGIFADLQGGLVILAPLIARAAAAFLPH